MTKFELVSISFQTMHNREFQFFHKNFCGIPFCGNCFWGCLVFFHKMRPQSMRTCDPGTVRGRAWRIVPGAGVFPQFAGEFPQNGVFGVFSFSTKTKNFHKNFELWNYFVECSEKFHNPKCFVEFEIPQNNSTKWFLWKN